MDVAELINAWFDVPAHEDGDFIRPERTYAFEIIGPNRNATRIIYCTKQSITHRLLNECNCPLECGVVSRGGLPDAADIDWLRNLIGQRELVFLGDMDPADIMIFGWLRAMLQPVSVTHLGINNQLNLRLGYPTPERHRIKLCRTENNAVSRLEEFVPDVEDVLGVECLNMLHSGYKIELEAIVWDHVSQIME